MYENELATADKLHAFFKAIGESRDVLSAAVAAQAQLDDLQRKIADAQKEQKKALDIMLKAQKQAADIEADLEVHKKKFHEEFQTLHDRHNQDKKALEREFDLKREALQRDFEAAKTDLDKQLSSLKDEIESHSTKLHAVKRELEGARSRVLKIAAG